MAVSVYGLKQTPTSVLAKFRYIKNKYMSITFTCFSCSSIILKTLRALWTNCPKTNSAKATFSWELSTKIKQQLK